MFLFVVNDEICGASRAAPMGIAAGSVSAIILKGDTLLVGLVRDDYCFFRVLFSSFIELVKSLFFGFLLPMFFMG